MQVIKKVWEDGETVKSTCSAIMKTRIQIPAPFTWYLEEKEEHDSWSHLQKQDCYLLPEPTSGTGYCPTLCGEWRRTASAVLSMSTQARALLAYLDDFLFPLLWGFGSEGHSLVGNSSNCSLIGRWCQPTSRTFFRASHFLSIGVWQLKLAKCQLYAYAQVEK